MTALFGSKSCKARGLNRRVRIMSLLVAIGVGSVLGGWSSNVEAAPLVPATAKRSVEAGLGPAPIIEVGPRGRARPGGFRRERTFQQRQRASEREKQRVKELEKKKRAKARESAKKRRLQQKRKQQARKAAPAIEKSEQPNAELSATAAPLPVRNADIQRPDHLPKPIQNETVAVHTTPTNDMPGGDEQGTTLPQGPYYQPQDDKGPYATPVQGIPRGTLEDNGPFNTQGQPHGTTNDTGSFDPQGYDRPLGTPDYGTSDGQSGNGQPYGQTGDDQPHGQTGHNWPQGQAGDDRPHGQTGDDRPHGQTGHNGPQGQTGDDRPHGQTGDDQPYGQTGDDRPQGQTGDDRPEGRPDRDPPGRQIVCLGGRIRGGRCGCRQSDTRKRLRRGIFACAPGGTIPTIPGVSAIAASIALAAGPPSTNQTPPDQASPPPPTPSPAANLLPPFVPDQVLVSLPTASQETVEDDVAQTFGLELVNRWPLDLIGARLVLYRIPDGRPVATVVAALQADGRITGPQPNYYYTQQAEAEASEEAGPSLDLQYALNKLEIGPAHRIATGNGVTIAVIDTQIDTTHPDLAGAIRETFDATGEKTVAPDNHGTAIAGIIGAHGTLKGVAPGSALLGINAFMPTGRNVAATTATLLRGLDWAARKKATIVNLSLSGPRDDFMKRGVEAAIGGGIVVVAAAGNGGEKAAPAYPAAYDGVIAVTAIDIGDRLYAEANRGDYIAIAAPGVDVLTPALDHAHLLQSGTSFAAAHVSAIIALMVERDPSLTLDDIRAALAAAAKDLGSPGRDALFGSGSASALAALNFIGARKAGDDAAQQVLNRQ